MQKGPTWGLYGTLQQSIVTFSFHETAAFWFFCYGEIFLNIKAHVRVFFGRLDAAEFLKQQVFTLFKILCPFWASSRVPTWAATDLFKRAPTGPFRIVFKFLFPEVHQFMKLAKKIP